MVCQDHDLIFSALCSLASAQAGILDLAFYIAIVNEMLIKIHFDTNFVLTFWITFSNADMSIVWFIASLCNMNNKVKASFLCKSVVIKRRAIANLSFEIAGFLVNNISGPGNAFNASFNTFFDIVKIHEIFKKKNNKENSNTCCEYMKPMQCYKMLLVLWQSYL